MVAEIGSDIDITSCTAKRVGNVVFAQINFTFASDAQQNETYQVADMRGFGAMATRGLGSYLNGLAWVSGGGIATVNTMIAVRAQSEQFAQFVFLVL